MGRRRRAGRPADTICAFCCDRRGPRDCGDGLAQRRADRDPAGRQGIARSFTAGAKVYAEVFPARLQRGAGLPSVERLAYFAELATVQLGRIKHLILIDAKAPASFFAYPGKQSYLVPDGCQVHQLVGDSGDVASSGSAPAPPVPERNRHWILPIRTLTSCPSVTAWAFHPPGWAPVRSSLPRLSWPSPNQGHTSSRLSSRALQ